MNAPFVKFRITFLPSKFSSICCSIFRISVLFISCCTEIRCVKCFLLSYLFVYLMLYFEDYRFFWLFYWSVGMWIILRLICIHAVVFQDGRCCALGILAWVFSSMVYCDTGMWITVFWFVYCIAGMFGEINVWRIAESKG